MGLHGFLSRAVKKATDRFMEGVVRGPAESQPAQGSDEVGGTVNDLVRAVRDEDCKVHVVLVSCFCRVRIMSVFVSHVCSRQRAFH